MRSKTNLLIAPAFLALALFFLPQTGWGEETAADLTTESNDDSDDGDGADDSHKKKQSPRVTADGTLVPDGPISLAAVTESTTIEMEAVVVHGFDVNPVEYPALPEVEGTRINSGKKTSFVKPEEFPTIANNNYREALATTPGLLVSEEPNSPVINFGYRGLDSQRAEFMQVLKDGNLGEERAVRFSGNALHTGAGCGGTD